MSDVHDVALTGDDQPFDDEIDDVPADDDGELPPEGDDALEGEDGADDPPPRPESRAAREIRTLREQRQAAERRAQELEAEVSRYRQPTERRVDPAEEERQFRARIADLPYEQQLFAVEERARQQTGQQLQGLRLELARTEDRIAFSDLKRENPVAARHSAEVERQFNEYAAKGQFVSREILLKNILGDLALKGGGKIIARDRARARGRVDAETGRRALPRSDERGGGRADRNSLEAIEARLRGKTLDQL